MDFWCKHQPSLKTSVTPSLRPLRLSLPNVSLLPSCPLPLRLCTSAQRVCVGMPARLVCTLAPEISALNSSSQTTSPTFNCLVWWGWPHVKLIHLLNKWSLGRHREQKKYQEVLRTTHPSRSLMEKRRSAGAGWLPTKKANGQCSSLKRFKKGRKAANQHLGLEGGESLLLINWKPIWGTDQLDFCCNKTSEPSNPNFSQNCVMRLREDAEVQ